jgi:hypothetical protein
MHQPNAGARGMIPNAQHLLVYPALDILALCSALIEQAISSKKIFSLRNYSKSE